eukprot:3564461-Prymnesium_polylepis.2
MAVVSSFSLNCAPQTLDARGQRWHRTHGQGGARTSSAANFRTAVKGAPSGTFILRAQNTTVASALPLRRCVQGRVSAARAAHTRYGSFGSDVSVILNWTFPPAAAMAEAGEGHGAVSSSSRWMAAWKGNVLQFRPTLTLVRAKSW